MVASMGVPVEAESGEMAKVRVSPPELADAWAVLAGAGLAVVLGAGLVETVVSVGAVEAVEPGARPDNVVREGLVVVVLNVATAPEVAVLLVATGPAPWPGVPTVRAGLPHPPRRKPVTSAAHHRTPKRAGRRSIARAKPSQPTANGAQPRPALGALATVRPLIASLTA